MSYYHERALHFPKHDPNQHTSVQTRRTNKRVDKMLGISPKSRKEPQKTKCYGVNRRHGRSDHAKIQDVIIPVVNFAGSIAGRNVYDKAIPTNPQQILTDCRTNQIPFIGTVCECTQMPVNGGVQSNGARGLADMDNCSVQSVNVNLGTQPAPITEKSSSKTPNGCQLETQVAGTNSCACYYSMEEPPTIAECRVEQTTNGVTKITWVGRSARENISPQNTPTPREGSYSSAPSSTGDATSGGDIIAGVIFLCCFIATVVAAGAVRGGLSHHTPQDNLPFERKKNK